MEAPRAYDEFLGPMADFASAYLDPAFKKQKAGEPYELPTDGQFSSVFYGFTEISAALEGLSLTEVLIGVAPPRAKRIEKDRYLNFLVGAYLQEVYILEQRLTAYAKKISRLYRKPALPSAARRIVYEPLAGIIDTRGVHVHSHRFTDAHLDMVSTMALFRRLGHQLGDDLDFEYTVARHEWSKRINTNNEATRHLVDQYCKLLRAVMCEKGKIVLPQPESALRGKQATSAREYIAASHPSPLPVIGARESNCPSPASAGEGWGEGH